MTLKVETTTIKNNTLTLVGDDLNKLLQDAGVVPKDVTPVISFTVPGGGDWSNMEVIVDSVCPIYICWKIIEESSNDDVPRPNKPLRT